jgi:protein TonB
MALKNLVYPKIARKRGWSGTTTIELQIATDGKLIKAVVTHSSGREALDDAALKSVLSLKGKELPKPKTLTKISLPIRFALK